MQQAGWQRWVPLTGILFVVLLVIGNILMNVNVPMSSDPDSAFTEYYSDSGNRTAVIAGAYLFTLGGLALLLFFNRLRGVIHDAEGGTPLLATAAFAGGVVFVTAFLVATATFAAVPGAVAFGDEKVPDADVLRILPQIGYALLLVMGMFPAIFMILATALASHRYGIFPAWFNWFSLVCAVVLLFAALFIPGIALLLWLIVASVLLMRKEGSAAPAAA